MKTFSVTSRIKRIEHILQTRYGLWGIGVISFLESSLVIPIITDPFMMAYVLANRTKPLATLAAIVVTTSMSLVGGITAYFMAVFFNTLTLSYMSPSMVAQFYTIANHFQAETFILTVIGAVTPLPYTFMALAAGFVKGNIWLFILGTIVGRGTRYSLVGYLTYRFGTRAISHLRQNILILSVITMVVVIVYFLWLVY